MKTQWTQKDGYQEIHGRECTITLEPRPGYCDRGRFLVKVFPLEDTQLSRDLDHQDGWPRYYFDETRAKLEIEAWMKQRGQTL